MALGGFAFVLGSALQASAPEIVALVLGRVLLGIGIGFANQVGLAGLSTGHTFGCRRHPSMLNNLRKLCRAM